MKKIEIGDFVVGGDRLTLIAGPCALESLELGLEVGRKTQVLCEKLGLNYIFKASYDKANRTSISSPRGPGIEKGLQWLAQIKAELGAPILTDIHKPLPSRKSPTCCRSPRSCAARPIFWWPPPKPDGRSTSKRRSSFPPGT